MTTVAEQLTLFGPGPKPADKPVSKGAWLGTREALSRIPVSKYAVPTEAVAHVLNDPKSNDKLYFPGVIASASASNVYSINYADGDFQENVPLSCVMSRKQFDADDQPRKGQKKGAPEALAKPVARPQEEGDEGEGVVV